MAQNLKTIKAALNSISIVVVVVAVIHSDVQYMYMVNLQRLTRQFAIIGALAKYTESSIILAF